MSLFLLLLAVALAILALLNIRRAPDWGWSWKTAILTGEYGHWLVLLPLGLACVVVAQEPAGPVRLATLLFCTGSVAGLLRPVVNAWWLDRGLGGGALSFGRLYAGPEPAPAPVCTEVFARPAGQELKLDFYRALAGTQTRPSPHPCIVVIHGGGWDGGDRTQLAGWNARFAARGYAVAAISYRLAPQAIWPAQAEDVRAAIAWLKANAGRLGIDPARLVLLGRSAGGQLATAVGYGAHDPAIRGVIALYAPHDMPFAWSVSREDDTLNSVKLMSQYLGGPPDTPAQRERYESASGQLLASRDSPPTLLIHGVPDTLAWSRHSERLAARLAELGVKHTHLQLPWATHGFDFNPDGPGGQLADYAITRFLAEITK
jgi:acetyl esterase/lipase